MTIIVDVKNEILGNSEFWRGDESRIAEIHNIPARETAKQVVDEELTRTLRELVADGKLEEVEPGKFRLKREEKESKCCMAFSDKGFEGFEH